MRLTALVGGETVGPHRLRLGLLQGECAVPDDFDRLAAEAIAEAPRGSESPMRLLLDTHLLIWTTGDPGRLSTSLRERLEEPANTLVFSVASLSELLLTADGAMVRYPGPVQWVGNG